MNEILSSFPHDPLPIVALLWAASIACVIICARNFFAGRATAVPVSGLVVREPYIDPESALATAPELRGVGDRPGSVSLPYIGVADPTASPRDRPEYAEGDQQPGPVALPDPRSDRLPVPVLGAMLRERVAKGGSAGLRELVRALYLDQSNFTFHTIAELSADDRELARRLLDAWLADPAAVEDWETLHAAVRVAPLPSQHA